MKIYTRIGDKGLTSFYMGGKVSKSSARVEALGTLDELNASVGVCVSHSKSKEIRKLLRKIQNELFNIGAEVASPKTQSFILKKSEITKLEKSIDFYSLSLPALTQFILPGGTVNSSFLHFARTIVRRAERAIVLLSESENINPQILSYLNRLSDLLFVLARYSNFSDNTPDLNWVK